MNDEKSTEPAELRPHLTRLRDGLLRLHKALLESERIEYEKTFGKIQSPYQFWQLLTSDPWFAWLRPLSQLAAEMDETLDAKEPLTRPTVDNLAKRTYELLAISEASESSPRHYYEAMQRDPDVVFAHAEMNRLLKGK